MKDFPLLKDFELKTFVRDESKDSNGNYRYKEGYKGDHPVNSQELFLRESLDLAVVEE